MKLGLIVDVKPTFVHELLADWQARYPTNVFAFESVRLPLANDHVNNWRKKRELSQFLAAHDVVFNEWAGQFAILASQIAPANKLIVRLHSFELHQYADFIHWDNVARVILVSRAMQRRFNERFPQQAHKTVAIDHGKSLDRFQPVKRPFRGTIGMLGHLTPIKRVYDIVLTMAELNQQGHRLQLHLAGEPRKGGPDGRYNDSLKSAIKKLGLQDQVIFHGFVSEPERWLQTIDIYISNSYWEGQQNALIEAMASGCYCLSHFWDGAEELLPQAQIYGLNSNLQQQIIAYCQLSPPEQEAKQQEMRQIAVEKFALDRYLQQTRDLIEEVYQNGG